MTILEVVSYLLPLSLVVAADDSSSSVARNPDRETLGEFMQRVSDELLWPKVLVRTAPPPGGTPPIAPDRR